MMLHIFNIVYVMLVTVIIIISAIALSCEAGD